MTISAPTDISNCVLWLKASDLTTLYQEIAGTTPVSADSQTVGTWKDKSGGAFDITAAADDTTRPTFNESGGVRWVTFDGTDDMLRRLADLGLYAAGAASIFAAIRGNPGTDRRLLASGNTGDVDPQYAMAVSLTTASTGRPFLRNDAATVLINTDVQVNAYDNTDRVFGLIDTGSSMTPWLGGTEGSATTYTRSGTSTFDNFALGAIVRTTVGSFWDGRIYEVAIYTKALTDTEAGDLSTYLANAFVPSGGFVPYPHPRGEAGGMGGMTGGMH